MPTGEKYQRLSDYLRNSRADSITMSFSQIEKILGFRLGKSAQSYPAFWSNSLSHSLAHAWLDIGYNSTQLNLTAQTVVFIKSGLMPTEPVQYHAPMPIQKRQRPCTLDAEQAVQKALTFYQETIDDKHGRYLSWEHCYNAFSANRLSDDDDTIDYLCLHLAFYLASWGMYRGSSFLLQKDYKVHEPVVRLLQNERYTPLAGITALDLMKDENLNLLEHVSDGIRKAYAEEKPSFEGVVNNATDTLVTKILLGVFGCVPAYDRYYVQAVKAYNVSAGNYNRDSVRAIAHYYQSNYDVFEKARKTLCARDSVYPPMKMMDMCMWQAAVELNEHAIESNG